MADENTDQNKGAERVGGEPQETTTTTTQAPQTATTTTTEAEKPKAADKNVASQPKTNSPAPRQRTAQAPKAKQSQSSAPLSPLEAAKQQGVRNHQADQER